MSVPDAQVAVARPDPPSIPTRLRAVPTTAREAPRKPSLVELSGVSKVFKHRNRAAVTAVDDVTVRIPEKSATLITGPSGSGKTTLLGIIGCLMRPTSGRVVVLGQEVTRLDEDLLAEKRRHHFGFVFQHRYLIQRATALENVMVPGLPCRRSTRGLRARARALLSDLGLDERAHHRVEHLSGGERQRVALARALINDPDTIIADEPTTHLDADCSRLFVDLLGALLSQGKSAIVASHDPELCGLSIFREHVELRNGCLAEGNTPCS